MRSAFLLLMVAVFVLVAAREVWGKTTKGEARVVTFKSAGKAIQTEWFDSEAGDEEAPVVMVLHGSGGIEQGDFFIM
jgi:poly(3-hydroxybutyrate) depolymerase